MSQFARNDRMQVQHNVPPEAKAQVRFLLGYNKNTIYEPCPFLFHPEAL